MKLEAGVAQTTNIEDFDDFFSRTFADVARAGALVARDRGTGQDLAQEAFFRLYERWREMESVEHARRFVYRVAINLARSHLRKHLRVRLSGLEPRAHDTRMPLTDAWVEIADALGHLSARQRAAVVLVDYVGLDAGEAAAVMRISSSTVRAHLMRGRRDLRQALSLPDEGAPR
jgi:RNA polymerase sigma-70 factor (ECF subfamily)